MAHYAFLDENNVVTEVIVGVDENELIEGKNPETWYGDFRQQKCVRTSYNHKIRKQFAGIGFTYDEVEDVFVRPKPYESWLLSENFDWVPPVPKPDGYWMWDETSKEWVHGETL